MMKKVSSILTLFFILVLIAIPHFLLFGYVEKTNGSAQFYVNGVAMGASMTGFGRNLPNSTGVFTLGNLGGGSFYLNGELDDVQVYNTNTINISNLYNNPCSVTNSDPNLVARWRFDNNGNDSTSNGNNLTNNNSATFTTDVAYTGCTNSHSTTLLKTSSQSWSISDASQNGALDITGAYTICAWVKFTTIPNGWDYVIASKWGTTGPEQAYEFEIYDFSGNNTVIHMYMAAIINTLSITSEITWSASPTSATWYHVCHVFNGRQDNSSTINIGGANPNLLDQLFVK